MNSPHFVFANFSGLGGGLLRDDVLDMVEDHITHNVVRVPAAGGSGRGAYFRQVGAQKRSRLLRFRGARGFPFLGEFTRAQVGSTYETCTVQRCAFLCSPMWWSAEAAVVSLD